MKRTNPNKILQQKSSEAAVDCSLRFLYWKEGHSPAQQPGVQQEVHRGVRFGCGVPRSEGDVQPGCSGATLVGVWHGSEEPHLQWQFFFVPGEATLLVLLQNIKWSLNIFWVSNMLAFNSWLLPFLLSLLLLRRTLRLRPTKIPKNWKWKKYIKFTLFR